MASLIVMCPIIYVSATSGLQVRERSIILFPYLRSGLTRDEKNIWMKMDDSMLSGFENICLSASANICNIIPPRPASYQRCL